MESRLAYPYETYDPLYGGIPLTELERDILLTGPLLRARNLKQLGTAAYLKNVPHTRLMHGLGVMHLVGLALNELFPKGVPQMRLSSGRSMSGAKTLQAFRLAGLLHDIGHGPMSHVFEDYVRRLPSSSQAELWNELRFPDGYDRRPTTSHPRPPRHEDIGWLMINSDKYGIAPLLRSCHSDMAAVIGGLVHGSFTGIGFETLGELISGSLDMDRLDYSVRDTYYLGQVGNAVGYSTSFDAMRLLESLVLLESEKGGSVQRHLAVRPEGVEYLDQFFALRTRFLNEVSRNIEVRVADLHFIHSLRQRELERALRVQDIARVMLSYSDQQLTDLLMEADRETMARIVTGPGTFAFWATYPLASYPSLLRFRLFLQAYDESYRLQSAVATELARLLGRPASDCDVLIGLNFPTDLPSATIGDESTPGQPYYQLSAYAQAFAVAGVQGTELTVVTPRLERHEAEAAVARIFAFDRDDPSKSTLWGLLDSVRPTQPQPDLRSYRLDLLIVSLQALFDHAMTCLCTAFPGPVADDVRRAAFDGLWVRGSFGLQGFFEAVQGLFPETVRGYEFKRQGSGCHSSRMSKDLFLLRHLGIFNAQDAPVPRTHVPFGIRTDIQLSEPGKQYATMLRKDGWQVHYDKVSAWLQTLPAQYPDLTRLRMGYCFGTDVCRGSSCITRPGEGPRCDIVISSSVGTTH